MGDTTQRQPDTPTDPALHASSAAENAVVYAANGLDVLQAATDAANAAQEHDAVELAAAATQAARNMSHQGQMMDVGEENVDPAMAGLGMDEGLDGEQSYAPFMDAAMVQVDSMRGVDPTVNPKLTRLRRACDMCSKRKVRCDEEGPPCRPCRELMVECTFTRALKRRGPPNKHVAAARSAAAAERMKVLHMGSHLEGSEGMGGLPLSYSPPVMGVPPVPTGSMQTPNMQQNIPQNMSPNMPQSIPQNMQQNMPTQNAVAAQALVSIAARDDVLDGEKIAPLPVLQSLVDDFFTFIHPLAPFPHEPTFRTAFDNRQDRTDPDFLALLASMIAALVATLPRSVRMQLKSQRSFRRFPKAVTMIEKCRDMALTIRGAKWVVKQPKTLDDAATSYFLALTSAYTHQWCAFRAFMSEVLIIVRELGFDRIKHPGMAPTFGNDVCAPEMTSFNHIKDQIGKRIFWCMVVSIRSFSQLGPSPHGLVILPDTIAAPYPSLPEDVNDKSIQVNEVSYVETAGQTTLLSGFRFCARIYATMNRFIESEYGPGFMHLAWSDQRLILRSCLLKVKTVIAELPPELQIGPGDISPDMQDLDDPEWEYTPPQWPTSPPADDSRKTYLTQAMRRKLQYEVQKANIHVSQLATRSFYVEKYFLFRDLHTQQQKQQQSPTDPDPETDAAVFQLMTAERELIVLNLFNVLSAVKQRNLEPNGASLINKIRQIASSLVHDAPGRNGPFSEECRAALEALINVLVRLEERTGPGVGEGSGPPPGTGQFNPNGGLGGGLVTPAIPGGVNDLAAQQEHSEFAGLGLEGGFEGVVDGGRDMTAQDEEAEVLSWADFREYKAKFLARGGFAGNF